MVWMCDGVIWFYNIQTKQSDKLFWDTFSRMQSN